MDITVRISRGNILPIKTGTKFLFKLSFTEIVLYKAFLNLYCFNKKGRWFFYYFLQKAFVLIIVDGLNNAVIFFSLKLCKCAFLGVGLLQCTQRKYSIFSL